MKRNILKINLILLLLGQVLFAEPETILESFNIYARSSSGKRLDYVVPDAKTERLTYITQTENGNVTYIQEWTAITKMDELYYHIKSAEESMWEVQSRELLLRASDLSMAYATWTEDGIAYILTREPDAELADVAVQTPEETEHYSVNLHQAPYFIQHIDMLLRFFPQDYDMITMPLWIRPDVYKTFSISNMGSPQIRDITDQAEIITGAGMDLSDRAVRLVVQTEDMGGEYLAPAINLWYLIKTPHWLIGMKGISQECLLSNIRLKAYQGGE